MTDFSRWFSPTHDSGARLTTCPCNRRRAAFFVACSTLLFVACGLDATARAQLPTSALGTAATVEAAAKTPTEEEVSARPTKASLKQQRAHCARELERLQQAIDQLRENGEAQPPADLTSERALWTRLDMILAQRTSMLDQWPALEEEFAAQEAALEQMRVVGPEEDKPYSFLLLDEARDRLRVEEDLARSNKLELRTEQSLLDSSRDQFEASESDRRTARDAISAAKDSKERQENTRDAELSKVRARLAQAEIRHHRERIQQLNVQEGICRLRIETLKVRIAKLRELMIFTESDLKNRVDSLDAAEAKFRQQLANIEHRQRRLLAKNRWNGASHVSPDKTNDLETQRFAFESTQKEIRLVQQIIEEIIVARETWRRRYDLDKGVASDDDVPQWLDEALAAKDRLEQLTEQLQLGVQRHRNQLSSLKRSLVGQEQQTDTATSPEASQVAELERLIDVYNEALVLIDAGQRLHSRFREELRERLQPRTIAELIGRGVDLASWVWGYEFAVVDDQSITVRKVVSGLFLVLVGLWLSRYVSRFVGKRLAPRLGIHNSGAAAIQSVVFYILAVSFCFVSLEIINVPLTIFAFLGGAIAIGIGFGSQNILNNFISGLILLAERPIRIGDLVNVNGIDATIEHIGARSTRVRTGDNLDILVPNSKFLENNVTNWTLSDTRIRTKVTVGVAYGSPTQRVRDVLEEVVKKHPSTLAHPAPILLFRDFGDSALTFEAHFWVHMRTVMERAIVESDIRYEIDDAFRRDGITIAFPQSDVHLDISSPIEIQMPTGTNRRLSSTAADVDATARHAA